MKRNFLAILTVTAAVSAQAAIYDTGTLTVNQSIPDGSIYGFSTSVDVSAAEFKVTEMTVNLNVSGGYNGDLYAYLRLENNVGTYTAVLLNRVGRTATDSFGYGDAGFNVTFVLTAGSEAGTTDIHTYGGNGGAQLTELTGQYLVDGRYVSPVSVTDTVGRTATLEEFTNLDPNGTWTLFFADMVGGGDPSTLNSWQLTFDGTEPVPEPVNVALMIFGGLGAGVWGVRRWRAKRSGASS